MKEVKNPQPSAAIVGDTEDIFSLECPEKDYLFVKMGLSIQTALRKVRIIHTCLDNSFDSESKPYIRQLRSDAMEELDDLQTLLEYCENNDYYLVKR